MSAVDQGVGSERRAAPPGPTRARTCACERPIVERDPGGCIGCAKCGRGIEPAAGDPMTDEAAAPQAEGPPDQGAQGPCVDRIEWPFALAGDPKGAEGERP